MFNWFRSKEKSDIRVLEDELADLIKEGSLYWELKRGDIICLRDSDIALRPFAGDMGFGWTVHSGCLPPEVITGRVNRALNKLYRLLSQQKEDEDAVRSILHLRYLRKGREV